MEIVLIIPCFEDNISSASDESVAELNHPYQTMAVCNSSNDDNDIRV
jgi:hypothetical protein